MRCVLFFFLCVLCVWIYNKWKSAQRRCTHCALAVVRCSKKFRHTAHPFQGVQNGQNLISWRWSLPLPTNPVWWRLMHTISSYRGNRSTNTHTNTQTGLITIHCTAALLACSVIITGNRMSNHSAFCCSKIWWEDVMVTIKMTDSMLTFYRYRMPFLSPNQYVQSTECKRRPHRYIVHLQNDLWCVDGDVKPY